MESHISILAGNLNSGRSYSCINSHLVVVVVALVVDGTMAVVVVGAVPVVSVLHRFEELFLFGVLHRDRKDSKNSIHNKHQSQIGLLQL